MTTYFCDGLKDVTVVNGVARLEFHRLEVVERGGDPSCGRSANLPSRYPSRVSCTPSACLKTSASGLSRKA